MHHATAPKLVALYVQPVDFANRHACRAAWTGTEPGKRRVLMVSARRGAGLQGDLEDRIVAAAARVWAEGAPAVCEQYRVMNASWKHSMGAGPAGT